MAYPIMLGRGSQAGSHPAHWRAAQHTKHCWEHGGSRIASTPTKQGSTLRVPTSSISQEGHITATSEHKVLELTLELWRLHKAPGGHRAHSSVPPGPFGHPFPKGLGRAGPIYTTQCHQHSPRGTFIPASQHLSHLLGASRGSQLAPLKLPPLASGGPAAAGSSGSASLASGKGQTR